MNKFNIGQRVYYCVSLSGQLQLESMLIIKIEKDKHGVFYTGDAFIELPSGEMAVTDDSHCETWREHMLFDSSISAFENLETQLQELRINL